MGDSYHGGAEAVGELAGLLVLRVEAPIDRPELGAWLCDPAKLALFDAVIAYKADRLSRGEDTDWSRIETWAADHGKTLVLVDSSTGIRGPDDLHSTDLGRPRHRRHG